MTAKEERIRLARAQKAKQLSFSFVRDWGMGGRGGKTLPWALSKHHCERSDGAKWEWCSPVPQPHPCPSLNLETGLGKRISWVDTVQDVCLKQKF
jgi:hypothetical protein